MPGRVTSPHSCALSNPAGRLRRLARAMLDGRPGSLEDALQEAVVNAWKHLRQFKAGFPVEPWFLAIVANQCRMQRRVRWWSVIKLSRAHETLIAGGQPSAEITDLEGGLCNGCHTISGCSSFFATTWISHLKISVERSESQRGRPSRERLEHLGSQCLERSGGGFG